MAKNKMRASVRHRRWSPRQRYLAPLAWLCIAAAVVKAEAPPSRYAITNDTVYDSRTGLEWQRSPPDSYAGCAANPTCTWAEAKSYCAALQLACGGWRLPSIKELVTIVDTGRYNPAIDRTAFPDLPDAYYSTFWSSTPFAGGGFVWKIEFLYGRTVFTDPTQKYRVRCVR